MILTALLYGGLTVLFVLTGAAIALFWSVSHQRMEIALSFVSGVMLGIAFFDLLPDALATKEFSVDQIMAATLLGFLTLFFLERFFCFHHHETSNAKADHHCDHGHQLSWGAAAFGLSLHSVIGGFILGASMLYEAGIGVGQHLIGFGTFIALTLHKPFDGFSLVMLLRSNHWPKSKSLLLSALVGLMLPLGMAAVLLGLHPGGESGAESMHLLLAFAAGTFICISLSDVLPELQFHQHDRVKLSLSLIAGIALAFFLGTFEPH